MSEFIFDVDFFVAHARAITIDVVPALLVNKFNVVPPERFFALQFEVFVEAMLSEILADDLPAVFVAVL